MIGRRGPQSSMASRPIRIVFVPAERRGNGRTVFGLIGGLLLNDGSGGSVDGIGGSPPGTIKKYPEVAAFNSVGRKHVLDVMDSDEEAEERAATIEKDLEDLEIGDWCERYSVPLSFAQEQE